MFEIQHQEVREGINQEIRQVHRTACIIGLAFIGSVFTYVILSELLNRGFIALPKPALGVEMDLIKYILIGITILTLFLIRPIKKIMLSGNILLQPPAQGQSRLAAPLQKLMSATIIGYALGEAVAIYGLVYYFLARNINDFYIFIIVSLFILTRHFPRYKDWENWLKGIGEGS
jgi:hypothetical protein